MRTFDMTIEHSNNTRQTYNVQGATPAQAFESIQSMFANPVALIGYKERSK